MARSKYHNRKVTVDGITFDSTHEAHRWKELRLLERAGAISGLRRQVPYLLIAEQREFCNEIYKSGKNKGCFKPGKLLERSCSYIADFVYLKDGVIIVEDAKGVRTDEYIIKRKLMLERWGIRIQEV